MKNGTTNPLISWAWTLIYVLAATGVACAGPCQTKRNLRQEDRIDNILPNDPSQPIFRLLVTPDTTNQSQAANDTVYVSLPTVKIVTENRLLTFSTALIELASTDDCGVGDLQFHEKDFQLVNSINCSQPIFTYETKASGGMTEIPSLKWRPPRCGCVQFRATIIEDDRFILSDSLEESSGHLTKTICIEQASKTQYTQALCWATAQYFGPEIAARPSFASRHQLSSSMSKRVAATYALEDRKSQDAACCQKTSIKKTERCLERARARRINRFCENLVMVIPFTTLRKKYMWKKADECCRMFGISRYICFQRDSRRQLRSAGATILDYSMDEFDPLNDLADFAKAKDMQMLLHLKFDVTLGSGVTLMDGALIEVRVQTPEENNRKYVSGSMGGKVEASMKEGSKSMNPVGETTQKARTVVDREMVDSQQRDSPDKNATKNDLRTACCQAGAQHTPKSGCNKAAYSFTHYMQRREECKETFVDCCEAGIVLSRNVQSRDDIDRPTNGRGEEKVKPGNQDYFNDDFNRMDKEAEMRYGSMRTSNVQRNLHNDRYGDDDDEEKDGPAVFDKVDNENVRSQDPEVSGTSKDLIEARQRTRGGTLGSVNRRTSSSKTATEEQEDFDDTNYGTGFNSVEEEDDDDDDEYDSGTTVDRWPEPDSERDSLEQQKNSRQSVNNRNSRSRDTTSRRSKGKGNRSRRRKGRNSKRRRNRSRKSRASRRRNTRESRRRSRRLSKEWRLFKKEFKRRSKERRRSGRRKSSRKASKQRSTKEKKKHDNEAILQPTISRHAYSKPPHGIKQALDSRGLDMAIKLHDMPQDYDARDSKELAEENGRVRYIWSEEEQAYIAFDRRGYDDSMGQEKVEEYYNRVE